MSYVIKRTELVREIKAQNGGFIYAAMRALELINRAYH